MTGCPQPPHEQRVVIVCGGRDLQSSAALLRGLKLALRALDAHAVRHGDARGGDRIASALARQFGLEVQPRPADWSQGRGAGPIRNGAMLREEPRPIGVIALPGGRGTKDMVDQAKRAGVPVLEVRSNGTVEVTA